MSAMFGVLSSCVGMMVAPSCCPVHRVLGGVMRPIYWAFEPVVLVVLGGVGCRLPEGCCQQGR